MGIQWNAALSSLYALILVAMVNLAEAGKCPTKDLLSPLDIKLPLLYRSKKRSCRVRLHSLH